MLTNVIVTSENVQEALLDRNAKDGEEDGFSRDDSSQENTGCSKTASDTALNARLGMFPLKTDMRNLKCQCSVRSCQQ